MWNEFLSNQNELFMGVKYGKQLCLGVKYVV